MSPLIAALLVQAMAPVTPVPVATDDGRRAVSLWIGADDRLSFAFGRAFSQALATSPVVRQAVPVADAGYRLVLRRLPRVRDAAARFTYSVDLLQPRTRGRERTVATVSGRCTQATLDTCATEATARIAKRLRS